MGNLLREAVHFFRNRKLKILDEYDGPIAKVFRLNDDCFEKIFSYLKLKDLYNVAKVNDRFLWAARWQFKRKIGRGLIVMDCFEILINSEHSRGLRIYIRDSSCIDTFFENFGPSIKRLEVYIRGSRKIDSTILRHCNDTMAEVQVYRTWSAPKRGQRCHSCILSMIFCFD